MPIQREKIIEARLLDAIRKDPHAVEIKNSTSDARTIADLLCGCVPTVFHDHSDWNPYPKFMLDLIGNMTPDIAFRSKLSSENRIYIEVKDSQPLGHKHYGIEDSQVVRYFLHLMAMSKRIPKKGVTDIRRAMLLCAPSAWFKVERNAKAWAYFLEHFSGLAKSFDITLGELHAESL
jgi:hypothetical protein